MRRLRRRPFFTIWNRLKRVYIDAQDRPHERRLGVRTALVTDALRNFEAQIQGHMSTPYRALDAIGTHMRQNGIGAPRFVDIGCGLGRPLYYFADRFEDLQGFEIAAPLHAAAQKQLETVRATHPNYARIAIHHADATIALPLDRPMVLFFYNPFGPKPLARLCERLRATQHDTHLYYVNPTLEAQLLAEMGRPADTRLHGWFDILYYRIAATR
ncbi:MAG: class I SAM-dependent methyltransferase [Sphingomonas sp.]